MVHEFGAWAHAGWYQFWAAYTAAQARNTGRPGTAINRRVVSFFREMCRTIRPTVSLELGAHEASFSRWAKRSFPEARCVAIEANPYVYDKHHEGLDAVGVEYHHLAAAATNGQVTINIPGSVWGRPRARDGRMASLSIHRDARGHEAVTVQAVRVDDFLPLRDGDRLVAWIDVEGASDAVLMGGHDVLARADAVYIEVENVDQWAGQWLDVDVARFFHDIGKVPTIRDIQRPYQYNVVFLDQRLAALADVTERAARVLRPPRRKHLVNPTT
jgi:FkbM family methyltransferase